MTVVFMGIVMEDLRKGMISEIRMNPDTGTLEVMAYRQDDQIKLEPGRCRCTIKEEK